MNAGHSAAITSLHSGSLHYLARAHGAVDALVQAGQELVFLFCRTIHASRPKEVIASGYPICYRVSESSQTRASNPSTKS